MKAIRSPKFAGDYRGRDLDCQEAIEPLFLKYAYGGTAFIDLEAIRSAVSRKAVRSGWSAEEVDAALIELARCYARQVARIKSMVPDASDA